MAHTEQSGEPIVVWDPLVRIVHWGLVASFTVAYLSGDVIDDLHNGAGYAVLGLVLLRIVWGLVGSRHARFSNFVRGPGAVLRYLRSLASGRPEHHLGHNPAGGVMVVAEHTRAGVRGAPAGRTLRRSGRTWPSLPSAG